MSLAKIRNSISTWILRENLRRFLGRISQIVEYRFEDWDWDAIRFGLTDTSAAGSRWYSYDLLGVRRIGLRIAVDGDERRLRVIVDSDDTSMSSIDAVVAIMQRYEDEKESSGFASLAEDAFGSIPVPNWKKIVACDAAHLSICDECQEASSFFTRRSWSSLSGAKIGLPRTTAGLGFLTAEARRYFFPAYLVRAFRDNDAELLEIATDHVHLGHLTPFQHELVIFAESILNSGEFGPIPGY